MHLDHAKVAMPEPERASEFYQRVFGLVETGRADGYIRLSSHPYGQDPAAGELWLTQGSETRLLAIALADDELEPWRRKAAEHPGVSSVSEQAVTFQPPASHRVEIVRPSGRVSRGASQAPFGITKLGHVTLLDPNYKAVYEFYTQVLGLKLSDQYEDHFFWMRFNPDHHGVAVMRGKTSRVHHVAFELADWEQVKLMCDHFHQEGFRLEAGPGRHGPGNNIFTYAVDPFGLRFEFFCEMARIEDDARYEPKVWRGERGAVSTNVWGQAPPPSFYEG